LAIASADRKCLAHVVREGRAHHLAPGPLEKTQFGPAHAAQGARFGDLADGTPDRPAGNSTAAEKAVIAARKRLDLHRRFRHLKHRSPA
jgi:hypothetical protein